MDIKEIILICLAWVPTCGILLMVGSILRGWLQEERVRNLQPNAQSFALWAILTKDAPLRSLEKDQEIQHICNKICAGIGLTEEEVTIILELNKEQTEEAEQFFRETEG